MPMIARASIILGGLVLLGAWAGPLPTLVQTSFAAHMTLHMLVVGVGVPLIAIGWAAWLRSRPGSHAAISGGDGQGAGQPMGVWRSGPVLYPVVASMVDFVVIWAWHTPALHNAVRIDSGLLVLEQGSFAAAALIVWLVAFTSTPLAGALELFFTSMHMVLLGALMALAPRTLYEALCGAGALADQQLGGAIMLAIGGVVYLGGGLLLVGRSLRLEPAR
jgi:putative membrane protein